MNSYESSVSKFHKMWSEVRYAKLLANDCLSGAFSTGYQINHMGAAETKPPTHRDVFPKFGPNLGGGNVFK